MGSLQLVFNPEDYGFEKDKRENVYCYDKIVLNDSLLTKWGLSLVGDEDDPKWVIWLEDLNARGFVIEAGEYIRLADKGENVMKLEEDTVCYIGVIPDVKFWEQLMKNIGIP